MDEEWFDLSPMLDAVALDDAMARICKRWKIARPGGASGNGWSRWKTFMSCPYKFKRQFVDGVGGRKFALEVGALYHQLLAFYYTEMMKPGVIPPGWYETLREELLNEKASGEVIREAYRIYDAYTAYYENDILTPLAVENAVTDPVRGITCRYDLIARIAENDRGTPHGTWIVEHKCQVGDTRILDYATGKLWKISDLHAQGIAPIVLATDENCRLIKIQATVPQPNEIRDVYEVVLVSGRRLCTSDNHPFLTARGWVPAANLTPSDRVAVPRTTSGYNGPALFADAEVEFVGLMLGDGTMTRNYFTKSEGPVLARFLTVIKELGYHEGDSNSDSYRVDTNQRAPSVRLSAAEDSRARVLLEQLGLTDCLAVDKFIPDELLSVPDRQVGILIGALWNTDGCVDLYEERYKDNRLPQQKVRIAYASRSQVLCENIQRLLLRTGLPSTVTRSSVEYEGARRDVWTTKIVTREGKRRFCALVNEGYIPFIKYSITEAFAAIKSGDDEEIPTELVRRVVPDVEMTGILRKQVKKFQTIERSSLRVHGEKRMNAAIEGLLTSGVIWDRVAHVIVTGRAMMYDIAVPSAHNFVANDIVTHNSGAQNDVVMRDGWGNDGEILGQTMIYRNAKLAKVFGELQGVMVNIVIKTKVPQLLRVLVPINPRQLKQHAKDLTVYRAFEGVCAATRTYPRSRAACVTRWGLCELFEECAR